jgi:hypothetical protein
MDFEYYDFLKWLIFDRKENKCNCVDRNWASWQGKISRLDSGRITFDVNEGR